MTAEPKRIEVTLETLLDSVDLAEDMTVRVAEGAGFDEDSRYRIGMAVREAMINAVQYGNQQNRRKKIYFTLEAGADRLVIRVRDEGRGFDLSDVPDPVAEENLLKTSGRGIFLIRAFMDEFDVRRTQQGGAEVIMSKRYPASPERPESGPVQSQKED